MRYASFILAVLCLNLPAMPKSVDAQQRYAPGSVTAQDYSRAEGFLNEAMGPLVLGTGIRPTWVEDGRFWYRNTFSGGTEIIMVDPERRTRTRAFDHERMAEALSEASESPQDPFDLPFSAVEPGANARFVSFELDGVRFVCDTQAFTCRKLTVMPPTRPPAAPRGGGGSPDVPSPDGTKAAFIRNQNLWLRNTRTGEETRLTTDGVEDFGYATDNAGWTKSDRPVLLWSPDSKKIATFQHDGRGVGMMYLVSTAVGHPELEAWKYPLPEDSVIFRIHRVVIHVDGPDAPRVVRLDMPPDQHRSTICDHIYCNGAFSDVEWAPDGSQLAFVSSSRDHKEARLRVADPETGAVREVMDEKVETFFESGEDMVNWHFLPEYDEVIWFSERSDWGHLYLYDLRTGALKHPITSGDWRVLQLRHIDRE
ncbi:MAG: DPP IV N-terminal domain-containing protein, partial [Longimicrobiales bacterium]|nr:DPP IV N-terminal domain-containing protein [Longimicrobiales bacterium]